MSNNVIETFLANGGGETSYPDTKQQVAVIGAGQSVVDLEKFRPTPDTIKVDRKFDDLRGFVGYINDFKSDETIIFAGRERIEVVFDYHSKDAPRWGNHKISFTYQRSARWKLWESKNNQWMKQRDFADFLDSGLNEVVEPQQGGILSVVKDFLATIKAEAIAEITEGGGTSFNYSEVTKGGSNKKTEVLVPESIGIQVAPFEGIGSLNSLIDDTGVQVPVFMFKGKICWRLDDENRPEFKVQLLHFESAVEETLEALRVAMQHLTGCKVYIGG